jgi:IS605 OrfB family transposase
MLTRKIKLDESYLPYIKTLVKESTHLRNILILLYEETKDIRFLKYDIIRALVFDTKGGKKKNDLTEIKNKYKNSLNKYGLKQFNHIKNKIIEEVVKRLDGNYKTCFKLLKNNKQEKFSIKPKKLSKIHYGTVLIPNEAILKSSSKELIFSIYSKLHTKGNKIKIYCNVEDIKDSIRACSLQLVNNECYLNVHYKQIERNFSELKGENILGIDPGMNNHLSIVDTNIESESLLIRSSSINRINHSTLKIIDRLNSKIDLEKNYNRKKSLIIKKKVLFNKRSVIINQELHKISKRIVEHCIKFNVSKVVMGFNKNQKNGLNLGKKNNRKFLLFPHEKLRNILSYLLPLYGITYIEQEESYTSKLSCINNEVWKYSYGKKKPTDSYGVRGFKGITSLFKDKLSNIIFHSDINGAYNIIQKYLRCSIEIYIEKLCNPILIKNDFEYLNFLRGTTRWVS